MNFQPAAELDEKAAQFKRDLTAAGITDAELALVETPWAHSAMSKAYKRDLKHDTQRVPTFFEFMDGLEAWLCVHQEAPTPTWRWLPENGTPQAEIWEDFLVQELGEDVEVPGMKTGYEMALHWGKKLVVKGNDPSRLPDFFFLLKCMKVFDNRERALGHDVTG